MSETTFKALGLSKGVARAIDELGFEIPTEIQERSIPVIREGRDVIGRSQTGTGKTIAFGIPALEAVNPKGGAFAVQVLVLCPTRELCLQAGEILKRLSRYSEGINVAEIYGGAPMGHQIMKLKRANIVIGTPGRVMDHLRRKTMRLQQLKMVVLDEADEMLSMGFREDIETILTGTPESRQTILFSATMPPEIMALTKTFQTDPALVAVNKKQITLDNIKQLYYQVPAKKKKEALNILLQYHNPKRTLVFVNTKKMADEIALHLNETGYQAQALHGDMRQNQRTQVMDEFKAGRTAILVATDVAARGIDVNDIDFVINYDIPQNAEYYVHRIGRTGRAGKSGSAISICEGNRQVQSLQMLGRTTKSAIERLELPQTESIRKMQDSLKSAQLEAAISAGGFHYEALLKSLLEAGHGEKDIALAALQLCFGEPQKFEELKVELHKKSSHKAERENVGGQGDRIRLNVGREQKIAPNHIVGAIAEATELSGKDIGKIQVFREYSLVSVPPETMEQTLLELKGIKICGVTVNATPYWDIPPKKNKTAPRRDGRKGSQSHRGAHSRRP